MTKEPIQILGHNFIPFTYDPGQWDHLNGITFDCTKCSVRIYGTEQNIHDHMAVYFPDDGRFIRMNISCDEMIIKNLLE